MPSSGPMSVLCTVDMCTGALKVQDSWGGGQTFVEAVWTLKCLLPLSLAMPR